MSSGVTNYSVTELEVIKGAAGKIGVGQNGQMLDPDDVVVFRRNLNMIIKQWTSQADFAPGLKMWTRRRAYLFLGNASEYDIGPAGSECAESYVSTTLTSALSASSVANVADATGIVTGSRVGVVGDAGNITWGSVIVAGNELTLGFVVSSAAIGNVVFAYNLPKPVKPFDILSAVLRDQEGNDSPVDVNLSVAEYELIPNKSVRGTPSMLYQEARKDTMRVYLDAVPDDKTKVLRLVFNSYIEDSTAQTDTVDLPAEWFRALVGQLAIDSALDFSRPVTPELKLFRDESLKMAQNAHPSTSTAFYASEPDWY